MQSVEQFMDDYFRHMVVVEKRISRIYAPFRRAFILPDCTWCSRDGSAEWIGSEETIAQSQSDKEADVITSRLNPNDGSRSLLRYHLVAAKGKWKIQRVDHGCATCRGESGDVRCPICSGTGWLLKKTEKMTAPIQKTNDRPPPFRQRKRF